MNHIENLEALLEDKKSTSGIMSQKLKRMDPSLFEALVSFLTRHSKNGLVLNPKSKVLTKIIDWLLPKKESHEIEFAIKALQSVTDATIAFALSRTDQCRFIDFWKKINDRYNALESAHNRKITRDRKIPVKERPDYSPRMRVSQEARLNGWHHRKPGHA